MEGDIGEYALRVLNNEHRKAIEEKARTDAEKQIYDPPKNIGTHYAGILLWDAVICVYALAYEKRTKRLERIAAKQKKE